MRALMTCARRGGWRWLLALYAMSALLTCAFGLAGYCAAFTIAVLLWHRIYASPQRKRAVLHSVEAWYFDDGVRDLIETVDADAGDGR